MSRTIRQRWLASARTLIKKSPSKRRAARNESPLSRLLRIEPLEDRRLLAITVNTLVDEADGSIVDGDISLRDAIAASPAGGTINFSITGTIHLALGVVNVQDRIIQGPGAAQLTIDAHGASGVFRTQGTTTLSGLTITGGGSTVRGGGIQNLGGGNLTVTNSVITGNKALQGGGIHAGGAILDYSSVTVVNSTISGNQALQSSGIYGQGGGIFNPGYSYVTVDKSTISGNSAGRYGGGIYGGLTMTNSTVSGNSAGDGGFGHGGGIFVRGQLSVANSTISGNDGTGIRFINGFGGVVANSTITNNDIGIVTYGATLLNTIVAGNGDDNGDDNNSDITGTVDVSGSRNNLIGDPRNPGVANGGIGGPPAGGLANGVNGNIVGVPDPGLAPLANNGGPTQTHALWSFSPAINRGDNSLVPIDPSTGLPFTVDQTGAARIFGGGTVDMGAVEVQGTFVPSTVVNTAVDDVAANGLTSLREAIGFAYQLGGPVTFDPTVFATPKTISLVHGPLKLDGRSAPLVINGPGRALATVDGEDGPVVFETYGTSTISGLTITGAKFQSSPNPNPLLPPVKSYIGAIKNEGALTISGCAVSDNQTRGILNDFALNVVDSIISGNSAPLGAGIFGDLMPFPPLVVTVSNSIIENNTAIATVVDGNTVAGEGGGIYTTGTVAISNSTIRGNSAYIGGGVYVTSGTTTILNSTISGNTVTAGAGGIYGGDTTILNSTISGNSAGGGAGGIAGPALTILNSTISGNSGGSGGGIADGGDSTIRNSTITNNSASADGGGIYGGGGSTITNSIIAGNHANGTPNDLGANSSLNPASAYNLVGDAASTGGLVNGVNGNIVGANPALVFGPLADNGGPTLPGGAKLLTHALLVGSPAIDAGDPAARAGVGNIPQYDERGAAFTRVIGNAIDIGAFERQTPELTGDYNRNDKVDAADYVLWRKTTGTTGVPAFFGADGDGNSAVQSPDYTVWRAHFGQSLSGAGTAESNTTTEQWAAAPSAAVPTTTAAERGNVPANTITPAVASPFLSIADTQGSRQARKHPTATATVDGATAIPNDNALLAWLSSASLKESSLLEHVSSGDHSNDDSSQLDSSNPEPVDAIFAGLANSHLGDL